MSMTNEQRVRVDRLERYLIADKDNIYTEIRVNDLDTVLSLIKEQEEQLDKKDKQIDLMAERIEWLCKSNGILLDKEHDENFTQEDVKQYFERKVEDVKD